MGREREMGGVVLWLGLNHVRTRDVGSISTQFLVIWLIDQLLAVPRKSGFGGGGGVCVRGCLSHHCRASAQKGLGLVSLTDVVMMSPGRPTFNHHKCRFSPCSHCSLTLIIG